MERFVLEVVLFIMFLTFYSYALAPVCTESVLVAQAPMPKTVSNLIKEQMATPHPQAKVSTTYLTPPAARCVPARKKGKQTLSGLIREINSASLAPIFE